MNILTDRFVAIASGQVSAIDGKPYATHQPTMSGGFSLTGWDLFHKLFNHIGTPSATLISGGSAGAVALAAPASVGMSAIVAGKINNVPFALLSANAISGQPGSAVSTAAAQIRKVLVGMTFSAWPAGSSWGASNCGAQMVFVVGSAYAVSANSVVSGGQSAYFNNVPLPKPSGYMVALGWLNIPCSFAPSAGLDNTMMQTDYRETQGVDLTAVQGQIYQP